MRCKLGSWWVLSTSPLIQLYGCTCSINCSTSCTVVYESICLLEYAHELGYKKKIMQEVQCISCNNPVTTGHHPPTLKHSTTSSVLDPEPSSDFQLTKSCLGTFEVYCSSLNRWSRKVLHLPASHFHVIQPSTASSTYQLNTVVWSFLDAIWC